jgi:hypothetical protein
MPQRAEESIARTGEQSQRAAEPVEPLRGIVGHQIRQRGSRSSSSRDGRPDLSVTSADLGVYEPAGRVGLQALASRRHSTKGQWRRPPRPRKRREPRRATSPQRSGTRDAGPPSNLRSKGPDVAGRAHHAWHLTDVLRDQLQVARAATAAWSRCAATAAWSRCAVTAEWGAVGCDSGMRGPSL